MPIADTQTRCQHRQDILLDIFAVVGLPISPKCTRKVSEVGNLIGLFWTKQGHCLDDSVIESLRKGLQLIPRTESDARATIGLITYSENAFLYNPDEPARHGELMGILNDAVNAPGNLKWTEVEKLLFLNFQSACRISHETRTIQWSCSPRISTS